MKRRTIFLGIVLSIVFFGVTQQVSHAAYLDLIDQRTYKTPKGPVLQDGDECYTGSASLTGTLFVSADGHSAYFDDRGNAKLEYADCQSVPPQFSLQSFGNRFQIKPGYGEKIGDCVRLFYAGAYMGSVAASGTATSQAGIGGLYDDSQLPLIGFTSPLQILVNDIPFIIYGPKVISAPQDDSFNDTSSDSILARIGDNITIEAGSAISAFSTIGGSGSGEATVTARFEISIQPCASIPALTHWGVLAFVFVLLTTTWYLLRRRKTA
jgi:hypothetical protein